MDHLKRLLIVDDEETLTFSLYQTFITAPIECEVVTASSGEEALERYQKTSFDLVITDIAMPGISGFELLSWVKAQHPDTQVIVITAYGSDEREEEAYELGADFYIEKPFDIRELKSLVIKMLE
jgi:YesN/AraC family two-component response regulator